MAWNTQDKAYTGLAVLACGALGIFAVASGQLSGLVGQGPQPATSQAQASGERGSSFRDLAKTFDKINAPANDDHQTGGANPHEAGHEVSVAGHPVFDPARARVMDRKMQACEPHYKALASAGTSAEAAQISAVIDACMKAH